MKSRKCEITCCEECPFMDYFYYEYNGECLHLHNNDGTPRDLDKEINISNEIHPECPLEEWDGEE